MKKETNTFFVISPRKRGRCRQNLVHRLLNKFAAKWCKLYPPHLNSVSTLPCVSISRHLPHNKSNFLDRPLRSASVRLHVTSVRLWTTYDHLAIIRPLSVIFHRPPQTVRALLCTPSRVTVIPNNSRVCIHLNDVKKAAVFSDTKDSRGVGGN